MDVLVFLCNNMDILLPLRPSGTGYLPVGAG